MSSNGAKTTKPQPNLHDFTFSTKPISSHLLQATISVPPELINTVFKQAVSIYAQYSQPEGLKNMSLPCDFVETEHVGEIKHNVKKFILKHVVINHLFNQIFHKKIPIANHPRLTTMEFLPTGGTEYVFDLSIASPVPLKEWKLFTFKAPKRKKYKDLDKQVTLFIKREHDKFKKQDKTHIENKDWVNFESTIVTNERHAILSRYKSNFWIKINTTHVKKPFQMTLLGKKIGDTFVIDKMPFQEEFSDLLTENCQFLITVKSITKGSFLSVEALKNIFKLKNKTDLHNKLIEVFSYRNDISQRRSIIEEVFHLFFSKHRFEIPKHLTIRKQEALLTMLRKQPDYQVYKAQKDFPEKVALLAEMLLKEEILIDQITHKENIKATQKDINNYLSLFNNSRLREFVYFKPLFAPIEDSELPLSENFLKQVVQREKTLNHVIHTLTN